MPKTIRILSKDHVPWRYVHFLLEIHQNLIFDLYYVFLRLNLDNFKSNCLNIWILFCTLRFSNSCILAKYINGKLIYSAFRCIHLNKYKLTRMTFFCGPGSHRCVFIFSCRPSSDHRSVETNQGPSQSHCHTAVENSNFMFLTSNFKCLPCIVLYDIFGTVFDFIYFIIFGLRNNQCT